MLLYGYFCEWVRIWINISLDLVISYFVNGKDGNILCYKIIFLFIKFVLLRLLDIGFIFFGVFIDFKCILDYEYGKKIWLIYIYVYLVWICVCLFSNLYIVWLLNIVW